MANIARFKRYDKCDPALPVLKLTRAGHYLWRLRRKSGLPDMQSKALYEALEIIWRIKREVKEQIAEEKSLSYANWRARMEGE